MPGAPTNQQIADALYKLGAAVAEILGYKNTFDEILRKVEAGNVNLPLSGSLITGSQSLFGIKTEMQFGRLTMTSIFSHGQPQP